MRVKILQGIGKAPILLNATLVVCENNQGTPVMVAGDYGPEGTIRASHCKDEDFNDTLKKLGLTQVVLCDTIVLPPPPPGAKLIRDPRSDRSSPCFPT